MSRISNISFISVFLLFLAAPSIATLCRWNPMGSLDEKRALAPRPTESPWAVKSAGALSALAQAWEKYFNDHFGLRKLLTGSYRGAPYYLLNRSTSPVVVVGKSDGDRRWLFYDGSKAGDGVGFESMMGASPYPPGQLNALALELKRVTSLVRGRGIGLAIAVCPDKQTIYPEFLPASKQPPAGAVSRLDQFWAMAAGLDGIPLIDLRAPIRVAKSSFQLYYPGDTHWNLRAGAIAYKAITDVLETQNSDWRALPLERLSWQPGPPRVSDLIVLMGVPPIGGDLNWTPTLPALADPSRPRHGKVLLVADSFSEAIIPYLEVQFETVKRKNDSYRIWGLVTPQLLEEEKPDVVLVISVERYWTS